MFTDPIAQVVITNPRTGKSWDWTPPEFPFLTGVTIAWEMGALPSTQITIDVPYTDAIEKILVAETPFAIGNQIRARIGYATGSFTPWVYGQLLGDGIGVTLDPNGMSGNVTFTCIADPGKYQASSTSVVGANYMALLTNTADAMGCKLVAPEIEQMEAATAAVAAAAGDVGKFDPTAFHCYTYVDILKRVCQEFGMIWWVGWDPKDPAGSPRTLFVCTPAALSKGQFAGMRRTYRMRGVIDIQNNQFPCLSWAPEGATFATWLASDPTNDNVDGIGVEYIGTDTSDGTPVWVDSRIEELETAIFGDYGNPGMEDKMFDDSAGSKANEKKKDQRAPRRKGKPMPEVPLLHPPGKKGGHAASADVPKSPTPMQARAEAAQILGNAAQTGVITSIGVPEEAMGNLCNLAGCGATFDGPYQIRKSTHTYTGGNYDMTLTVIRQGTGGAAIAGEKKQTAGGTIPEA